MSLSKDEVTGLFSSIENHDVKQIDAMLEEWEKWDFDINENFANRLPLIEAVKIQDATITKYFLKQGADILNSSDGKNTPLAAAITTNSNCWPLIRNQLIDNHELNTLDASGNSAMHHAILFGNAAILKDLLDHGANANMANKNGQLPLEILAQSEAINDSNKSEMYQLLFPYIKFDLYTETDREKLADLLFSLSAADDDIYKYIVLQCDKGIIDTKSVTGLSALHRVVLNKEAVKIELLLSAGIDIHAVSPDGHTALMELIKLNDFPQKHTLINLFESRFSSNLEGTRLPFESVKKWITVIHDYHQKEKNSGFKNKEMSEERIKEVFLKVFSSYVGHLKSTDEIDLIKQELKTMPLIFSDKKNTFGFFTQGQNADLWQKTDLARKLSTLLEDRRQSLLSARHSHDKPKL